jgi:hypothetical protein
VGGRKFGRDETGGEGRRGEIEEKIWRVLRRGDVPIIAVAFACARHGRASELGRSAWTNAESLFFLLASFEKHVAHRYPVAVPSKRVCPALPSCDPVSEPLYVSAGGWSVDAICCQDAPKPYVQRTCQMMIILQDKSILMLLIKLSKSLTQNTCAL